MRGLTGSRTDGKDEGQSRSNLRKGRTQKDQKPNSERSGKHVASGSDKSKLRRKAMQE